MDKETGEKVKSIWSLIAKVIGFIIAAICGGAIESSTSVISNFLNH